MKVLAKVVSVLFVLIAAFLLYAVVAAVASSGGANIPVCIGYVVGSLVLGFGAVMLWRKSSSPSGSTTTTTA
jgi:hypothetical protein